VGDNTQFASLMTFWTIHCIRNLYLYMYSLVCTVLFHVVKPKLCVVRCLNLFFLMCFNWWTCFYTAVDLMGLLKWRDNRSSLQRHLEKLMSVDGEEVVKVSELQNQSFHNIDDDGSMSEGRLISFHTIWGWDEWGGFPWFPVAFLTDNYGWATCPRSA